MGTNFSTHPSGEPLHTLSKEKSRKYQGVFKAKNYMIFPFGLYIPSSFEAVSSFICRRRSVVVTRHWMIYLVLGCLAAKHAIEYRCVQESKRRFMEYEYVLMRFNIWFYNSNRLHWVLHSYVCLIWNSNTTNVVWQMSHLFDHSNDIKFLQLIKGCGQQILTTIANRIFNQDAQSNLFSVSVYAFCILYCAWWKLLYVRRKGTQYV